MTYKGSCHCGNIAFVVQAKSASLQLFSMRTQRVFALVVKESPDTVGKTNKKPACAGFFTLLPITRQLVFLLLLAARSAL